MNRWSLNIIIIIAIAILAGGCTSVGAINFPVNLNKDKEDIKYNPPIKNESEKDLEEEFQDETIEEEKNQDKIFEEEREYENPIVSKVHYYGDKNKNKIALTFDDGPESKYTTEILEILNEYDIKATFFVIGQYIEKYPEVLEEVYKEGHEIGNHSWNHKYFPEMSKETIDKEVLMVEEALKDVIGKIDYIFRPPYGAIKNREVEHINSLGYNIVNWSVDTRDWAGTSKNQMMGYLKQQLTPGGIILMHNTGNSQNTVEFLPEAIEWIIEQGYEFGTVSEVLEF